MQAETADRSRGFFLPRGTLLNTFAVALGGLIGWLAHEYVREEYQTIALSGLGIVTLGIGMKMLLQSRNIIIVAASIALGGILGLFLGIHAGVEHFAIWARGVLGASDTDLFVSTVITTSVLFCIGPMTLLGCIQDRIEGKIELLALKSTMDGIASIFFAAASGPAVIVTAGVVLVFQSILTYAAKPLKRIVDDPEMLSEITGAGGVMLIGTGLGLLKLKELQVSNYLPALVLAPLFVVLSRRIARRASGMSGT